MDKKQTDKLFVLLSAILLLLWLNITINGLDILDVIQDRWIYRIAVITVAIGFYGGLYFIIKKVLE